ncbi:MAG: lipoprotein [Pseudomonadota bacterium]
MKILSLTALLGFSILIGLSACGQTGPLYLPDNPSHKSTTTGN